MINLTHILVWCVFLITIINVRETNCIPTDIEGLENYSVYYGVSLLSKEKNNKSTCLDQLSDIATGIQRRDRWALKLLDASGAPETKLHWGNRFWLGSRSQCNAAAKIIKLPVSPSSRSFTEINETISPFPVEYYGIYFHHNSSMQSVINSDVNEFIINMGLCLPSSCTEQEIYSLVEEYFSTNKLGIQRLYNMELKMDSVKNMRVDFSWMKETRFKVFMYSIGFTIFLTICATLYDVRRNGFEYEASDTNNQNNNKVNNATDGPTYLLPTNSFENVFLCFSLYKNATTMFDTRVRGESQKFKTIFGMRFFLSSWIVLTHTIFYTTDATQNLVSGMITAKEGLMKIYSNATFTVDSFFTLSGFLMGYSFLDMERKKIEDNAPEPNIIKKIFLFIFGIFSRYLRLTPTCMVALGLTEFLSKWRQNETFYWNVERCDVNCPKYWWRNVLYIANMFPRLELCMGWTWYLSVDMQLFIICFAIMIFSSSNVKIGVSIFTTILLASNFYISYVGYTRGYQIFVDNHKKFFEIIYLVPWLRIGPYVVGIFAGYILRDWNGQLRISKKWISLGWLFSLGIFGLLTFGFSDNDIGPINSAIYVGWSRTFWSLATAWCVAACVSNNGGILGWLLSSKLWVPLSRVTYSVYLIHPIIILTFSSFKESTWEMSPPITVVNGLGFVVISFAFAVVFSLIFESPLVGITKIIVEGGKKSMNKQNSYGAECDVKSKKS